MVEGQALQYVLPLLVAVSNARHADGSDDVQLEGCRIKHMDKVAGYAGCALGARCAAWIGCLVPDLATRSPAW